MTGSTASWFIKKADLREAEDALMLMREVARWLDDTGRPLWKVESFRLEALRRAAIDGQLVLGYGQSRLLASMLLQTRDEFYWPNDAPGEALYIHKLVVHRSAAGQYWPDRLVAWASLQARNVGARFLRLDTADRQALMSLYQRLGFRVVDERPRAVENLMIYRLELPVRTGLTPSH